MEKIMKPRNLTILAVGVAALILIIGLFVLKIGVADNGQLQTVLKSMGLYDGQMSIGSGYYSNSFGVMGPNTSYSTANLAYDVGKIGVPKDGIVPVAIPAIVYSVLFLVGLFLILISSMGKYRWNNVLLAVLSVVMLADIGYISFFNTPYREAAAFSYLILTVGLFLVTIKRENIITLILLGVSGFLFAGSMLPAAYAGIVLGLFALRLTFLKKNLLWKIISIAVCVVTVFSGVYTITTTDNSVNLYNSVFYGALKDSETVEEDLAELGLPAELKEYAGVPSFEEKAQEFIHSPEYKTQFLDRISYSKIAMFYVKNLGKFLNVEGLAANNSNFIRTSYLGNYAADSGKQPGEQAGFFSVYSWVKPKVVPAQLYVLFGIFILMILLSIQYRNKFTASPKDKIYCEFMAIGGLVAIFMLNLPVILYGMSEISFHMFLYNAVTDLCVLAMIVGGTRMLTIRRDKLKETYGVNQ